MTLSFASRALIAALVGAQVSLVRAFDNSRYDNVSPDRPSRYVHEPTHMRF